MKKMLKTLAILMLAICVSIPAMAAEGEGVSMSGSLQPEDTMLIEAPFTGRVLACETAAGDLIKAGDSMIELETVRVYAPCDGTVAGLRAAEGDDLSMINALYGAAMYVEPKSEYIISASTTNAYDSNDNRMIHVGEMVYLTSVNNYSRTGEGLIIHVEDQNYVVEVLDGNIRLNETCRISRDEDHEEEKGRIGQGKTARNNPRPVTAEGSVLQLHVQEGDEVQRGQLLMEIVPDVQMDAESSVISAENDLIVLAAMADEGVQVQKGQAICEVFPVGTLQAVVYAEEEDLLAVQTGDKVTVELDAAPEEYSYEGEVVSVSYVPVEGMNVVCYEVRVQFENDDVVRMGMSVTVKTVR